MADIEPTDVPLAGYVDGLLRELENNERAGRDTDEIHAELARIGHAVADRPSPARKETARAAAAPEKAVS